MSDSFCWNTVGTGPGGAHNFCFDGDVRRAYLLSTTMMAYDYELKFGPNLGCTTENPFEILGKLLLQESKFIIFCPKFGSKELNHAATGFRLGSWGSKERRERREKGVLTAGHTRITFSSECPRDGDGEQLKCSEYIQ